MRTRNLACCLLILSLMISTNVDAQLSFHDPATNQGVLDRVIAEFAARSAGWQSVMLAAATRLYWTLVLISMVWTFGMMALRQADIGEFFAEFLRFTIFTGFFWWLLVNGPSFASSIYASLKRLGEQAIGTSGVSPSGIVDIGFMIWKQAINNLSIWSPVDSFVGVTLSAGILVLLAVVGVNMLLLLISGWILAFGGIFFLGFGGSRWTSDFAINYYKTVFGVGAQLMTMVLLVGIGNDLLTGFYNKMSKNSLNFDELGVMLVFCIALLLLIDKLPGLVAGILTGAGINGSGIGQFGAGAAFGAAMGAAGMASAAASMGGSMISSGAANAAGGAKALMDAYANAGENVADGSDVISSIWGDKVAEAKANNANQSEGSGGDQKDGVQSTPIADEPYLDSIPKSDSESSDQGSSDASESTGNNADDKATQGTAFGSDPSAFANNTSNPTQAEGGSKSGAQAGADASSQADTNSSTQPAAGASKSNSLVSGMKSTANAAGSTGKTADDEATQGTTFGLDPSAFANNTSNPTQSEGGSKAGAQAGADASKQADTKSSRQPTAGTSKSNSLVSGMKSTAIAAGKMAVTAGKITADTGANLVKGTAEVAKAKASEMKQAAAERISDTTGGKIAAAIRAQNNRSASKGATGSSTASSNTSFTGNSLAGASGTQGGESASRFPPPEQYKNVSNEPDFDPAAEIAAFVNRKKPGST